MKEWAITTAYDSISALGSAIAMLIYPAFFFILLALGIKGLQVLNDIKNVMPETRTTLMIACFNILCLTPLRALIIVLMEKNLLAGGLILFDSTFWAAAPFIVSLFVAVFLMDFASYWRHRLLHSKILWPSHAVHHSDTAVTWFTLERSHPVDSIITYIVDNCVLLLLGFPVEIVVATSIIRHYYGYFVHADLPWTYGILGKIFVSPAMHRWHHARNPRAYNTNYAAIFSLFDRWFGTFYVPGHCTEPLGVSNNMGTGMISQLTYAFKPRAYQSIFSYKEGKQRSS